MDSEIWLHKNGLVSELICRKIVDRPNIRIQKEVQIKINIHFLDLKYFG